MQGACGTATRRSHAIPVPAVPASPQAGRAEGDPAAFSLLCASHCGRCPYRAGMRTGWSLAAGAACSFQGEFVCPQIHSDIRSEMRCMARPCCCCSLWRSHRFERRTKTLPGPHHRRTPQGQRRHRRGRLRCRPMQRHQRPQSRPSRRRKPRRHNPRRPGRRSPKQQPPNPRYPGNPSRHADRHQPSRSLR